MCCRTAHTRVTSFTLAHATAAPSLLQLVLPAGPCCETRSAARISPITRAASWPSGVDGTLINLRYVGPAQNSGDAARLRARRRASPAVVLLPMRCTAHSRADTLRASRGSGHQVPFNTERNATAYL